MGSAEVVLHQGQAVVSAADFMPVFDIKQAVARQSAMSEFIGQILKADVDFGVIPGASKVKVLLKPGAEKLCTFFGLTPMFIPEEVIEDWSGEAHGGEPLFYYRYKCQLWRGERLLAEAIGSCNSREKKYRYRNGERVCPECSKPAIITGRAEYGGGFVCFKKKGGCGAKFTENDKAITGQEVGQVKNPDIADVVNTCQKIATKRALVAAVLIGTNASDSFTQDIEEGAEPEAEPNGHKVAAGAGVPPSPSPAASAGAPAGGSAPPAAPAIEVPEELKQVVAGLKDKGGASIAFGMLKKELLEALPSSGGVEYIRILQKHGIKPSGPQQTAKMTEALVEMWKLAQWAKESAAKATRDAQEAAEPEQIDMLADPIPAATEAA